MAKKLTFNQREVLADIAVTNDPWFGTRDSYTKEVPAATKRGRMRTLQTLFDRQYITLSYNFELGWITEAGRRALGW